MGTAFTSFDLYGQQINFLVDGESGYKTIFRALLSIVITIITISYAISRFTEMRNYENTHHLQIIEPHVNHGRLILQEESGINAAIGIYKRI